MKFKYFPSEISRASDATDRFTVASSGRIFGLDGSTDHGTASFSLTTENWKCPLFSQHGFDVTLEVPDANNGFCPGANLSPDTTVGAMDDARVQCDSCPDGTEPCSDRDCSDVSRYAVSISATNQDTEDVWHQADVVEAVSLEEAIGKAYILAHDEFDDDEFYDYSVDVIEID